MTKIENIEKMKFKKTTITIPNSLYGDRDKVVYAAGGIGVGKIGKLWGIFCLTKQAEVYYKLQRSTKAKAIEVAKQILALDVDWENDKDSVEFDNQFRAVKDEIRNIADIQLFSK